MVSEYRGALGSAIVGVSAGGNSFVRVALVGLASGESLGETFEENFLKNLGAGIA